MKCIILSTKVGQALSPVQVWGRRFRLPTLLIGAISVATLSAQTADPTPAKKTTKAETKKPATALAQPLTIPTDAVPKPDGTYSYTDKSGKKWIYNKTPFGVSKIQDVGEDAPPVFATTPKEQLIQATDAGDTVKFQRQTPFGVTKWEKKKSDLTDEERHIFESQQPKPPAVQPE